MLSKKHKYKPVILLLLLLVYTKNASSQQESIKNTKIGVVLSGGGAKGLAHIGTLKVIDSLGIQVDYIAGTSMGAIIGSLYASGYTGIQLDSIFKTVSFNNLINDKIPRSARDYYQRKQSERYGVVLPIKNFKVTLPSSLSKGQNFYNLLSRLLAHVKETDNFAKLPIPFFCMATDIETGKEIVLDSGYLPKAVNASSALPSLLAAVQIDGKQLIDGGVTNNYPVELLRKKGMDIIIGVDVQDDLKRLDELGSALDILTQINNYRTIEAMTTKSTLTDIYITPDIENFTVVSFDAGDAIIKTGEEAALKKLNELSALSTNYKKPNLKTSDNDEQLFITSLKISGNNKYSRSFIKGRFNFQIPGDITYEDINNGINNLQASNNFTKINYRIDDTLYGSELAIEVEESTVRNTVKLGIHYDELFRSAALLNVTSKGLLFKNDIISIDAIVGDNIRYAAEYFIDKGSYWSIGINSAFAQYDKQVSAAFAEEASGIRLDINTIQIDYNDWTQQFFVQTKLQNDFNITLGAELKKLRVFTETLITENPEDNRTVFENSAITSLYSKALFDSYDSAMFPSTGWRVAGDFHLYVYSTDINKNFNQFSIAQLQIGRALSFKKMSFRAQFDAGLPIGEPGNSNLDFFLGGYGATRINNNLPFFGYDFISLGGNTVLKALFEFDYEIFAKNHIILSGNLASVQDDLLQQKNWFSRAQYTGYAVGYGIETFLGPVELRYSFSPQNKDSQLFVNVGFAF